VVGFIAIKELVESKLMVTTVETTPKYFSYYKYSPSVKSYLADG